MDDRGHVLLAAAGADNQQRWVTRAGPRKTTAAAVAAIRAVSRLLVAGDLADGVAPRARMLCNGCQRARALPGFVEHGRYLLCIACAAEYQVAWAHGAVVTAGQYVRGKAFGEAETYALLHGEAERAAAAEATRVRLTPEAV
jgi:hypothetical protein